MIINAYAFSLAPVTIEPSYKVVKMEKIGPLCASTIVFTSTFSFHMKISPLALPEYETAFLKKKIKKKSHYKKNKQIPAQIQSTIRSATSSC